jgi:hypothetical protein
MILAGAFPLLSLLKPISRELAEEEHPLISGGIAKQSTASFQQVQQICLLNHRDIWTRYAAIPRLCFHLIHA